MSNDEPRIEGVRRLQNEWFKENQFLYAVNAAFDHIGFTDAYVKRLISRPDLRPKKHKAIKDAVWGMMEFDGASMRLIDSPVLQRLRRIKQLGFSYLTYPSAEHSRFPHSIGMAHIVSRFVGAIEREREQESDMQQGVLSYQSIKNLLPLNKSDLIHAALLHDSGHLPFSHAAESAIEASRARFTFGGLSYDNFSGKAEYYLNKKLPLSEALSLMVVLSHRFGKFYNGYVLDSYDDEAILRIACLIAGARAHEKCGNIQNIISSSSVDADKIDYISRDAVACGIPVGVDVSRVFLGSGLLGLDKEKALELGYSGNDRFVFALNASGWDTFDEIIRARSTLYQRVYLHAVTRTGEAVFARAVKLNAERTRAGEPADVELGDVIKLWSMSDDGIIERLLKVKDDEVMSLAVSLRGRQLPKKACALGSSILEMQVPMAELLPCLFGRTGLASSQKALEKLISYQFERRYTRGNEDTVDSIKFEDELKNEAKRLAKALENLEPGLVPGSPLEPVVFISIAALDQPKAEAPVFQHGELLTADTFTNVRGVSDAVDHFRKTGYVMASAEWREIVLLATRNVLYRRSEDYPIKPFDVQEQNPKAIFVSPLTLLSIDGITRRVGVSKEKLNRAFDALEQEGIFDDRPLLARRTVAGDMRNIATRFRAFDGEAGWRVTSDTIAAFVDQFPPRLRDSLIKCLGEGLYLNRSEISSSLAQQIEELEKDTPGGIVLVPLSPSSGGGVLASLKGIVKGGKAIITANSLKEGLEKVKDKALLVLVDDNAASGIQASAQLYAYAGPPRGDQWPKELADEKGVFEDKLPDEKLEKFKNQPFAIAVAAGHTCARDKIAKAAEALGLEGYKGLFFKQTIGASIEWPAPLREFLEEVGRDLISQEKFDLQFKQLTDQEHQRYCHEHSFGYGSFGGLTVLPTTVPASTVTALWMAGTSRGRPWIPLFLRWGHFGSVVFC